MMKRISAFFLMVLFPCLLQADDLRINVIASAQAFPDFPELSAEMSYPAFAFGFRASGMVYPMQPNLFDSAWEVGVYATAYPFASYTGFNISTGYSMGLKINESGYFNSLVGGYMYSFPFNNFFYTTIGWKLDLVPDGSVFLFLDSGIKFQIKYMSRNYGSPYGRAGFGVKVF